MRDFRKLQIWIQSVELAVQAYRLCNNLPKNEEFGLKQQIRRSAVSIAANIAEGCSRSSQKEYKHFLELAIGSAFELETHFVITSRCHDLQKDELGLFFSNLNRLQRSINYLIQKIRADLRIK